MPRGLKRYYGADDAHFITCSCYQRKLWLDTPSRRDLFLTILEQVRLRCRFVVLGYVVMPEHFHLLMSEPQEGDPSKAMQLVKQLYAQRVLRRTPSENEGLPSARVPRHVWQARFYDFNVWSQKKFVEKLHYMHMNPVKRKLVPHSKDWPWSSFSFYARSDSSLVRIDPMI